MANINPANAPIAPAGNLEPSPDDVGLRIEARRGATVVAVSGELDASNIHHLTDCAQRIAGGGRPFVLDLSQLDFLAAQGIRVLFELDEECKKAHVQWALVPGRPVTRLLRICDKDPRLPTASSIDQALQLFSAKHKDRPLLQVVP